MIKQEFLIYCDGCGTRTDQFEKNKTTAREKAAKSGWTFYFVDGEAKDFCPDCAPKPEPKFTVGEKVCYPSEYGDRIFTIKGSVANQCLLCYTLSGEGSDNE